MKSHQKRSHDQRSERDLAAHHYNHPRGLTLFVCVDSGRLGPRKIELEGTAEGLQAQRVMGYAPGVS